MIIKQDLLLCQTLKEALQARHLFVCGYSTTGKEAFAMLLNFRPEVVLVGSELPDTNAIEVIQFIRDQQIAAKCIIYAKSRKPFYLTQGMQLGIKGYLFANPGLAELHYCIHEVLEGREYISPLSQAVAGGPVPEPTYQGVDTNKLAKLTKREREVLFLISKSFTNNRIAEHICRSSATVNNHRYNIMKKLDLQGHHQLLPYALAVQELLVE